MENNNNSNLSLDELIELDTQRLILENLRDYKRYTENINYKEYEEYLIEYKYSEEFSLQSIKLAKLLLAE